jgi:hypothetical protein
LNHLGIAAKPGTRLATRLILAVEILRNGHESAVAKAIGWLLFTFVICRGATIRARFDRNRPVSWPSAEYGFTRQMRTLKGKP